MIETSVAGATVLIEPARETPLVNVRITALGGSAADPEGLEGTAHHIAELAMRGAGERDRKQIDLAFDELGTSLAVTTSRDSVSYSVTALDRNLDRAIDILGDVIARPRFAAAEHKKLVRETLSDLEEIRDDDAELAARYFARHFAAAHPYGRSLEGSEVSLARIGETAATDLCDRYRSQLAASNVLLGLTGNLDEGEAAAVAERLLGPLAATEAPATPVLTDYRVERERRVFLVDKPERSQSQVLIGQPAPRYAHEGAFPLVIVETAFGGMFSSRLMQEVRVKRGWSYDAGFRLARSRGSQWLRMSLAPTADTTVDAIRLVVEMFESLAADGLEDAEIEFARRHLIGNFALSRATARQRVRHAIFARTFDLPADFSETAADRLATVTAEEVAASIERYLIPDALTLVVVASAERMAEPLRRMGFGPVRVIPFREY